MQRLLTVHTRTVEFVDDARVFVQNAPKEGRQGIRLWLRFEGEDKLGISIHAEGKKQEVKPINTKLDEGVWTWIAIVGTNNKSTLAYQDGKEVSKQRGFKFQKSGC